MKLTVWEIFFMLLTVIPVSRMLYTIFMKLIVRIGTVDEEKWAAVGLGALGSMIGGAYILGRTSLTSLNKNPNVSAGSGAGGQPSGSLSLGAAEPTGIPGVAARPVGGGEGTSIQNALRYGAAVGSAAANYGGMFGISTSFAAPQVAAPMAVIGGVAAKAVAAPLATAYSIGRELLSRTDYAANRKLYQSRLEALRASGGFSNLLRQGLESAKEVTGARTVSGAFAAMAGAVLTSPLGRGTADLVSRGLRWAGDLGPLAAANTVDGLRGFWRS